MNTNKVSALLGVSFIVSILLVFLGLYKIAILLVIFAIIFVLLFNKFSLFNRLEKKLLTTPTHQLKEGLVEVEGTINGVLGHTLVTCYKQLPCVYYCYEEYDWVSKKNDHGKIQRYKHIYYKQEARAPFYIKDTFGQVQVINEDLEFIDIETHEGKLHDDKTQIIINPAICSNDGVDQKILPEMTFDNTFNNELYDTEDDDFCATEYDDKNSKRMIRGYLYKESYIPIGKKVVLIGTAKYNNEQKIIIKKGDKSSFFGLRNAEIVKNKRQPFNYISVAVFFLILTILPMTYLLNFVQVARNGEFLSFILNSPFNNSIAIFNGQIWLGDWFLNTLSNAEDKGWILLFATHLFAICLMIILGLLGILIKKLPVINIGAFIIGWLMWAYMVSLLPGLLLILLLAAFEVDNLTIILAMLILYFLSMIYVLCFAKKIILSEAKEKNKTSFIH